MKATNDLPDHLRDVIPDGWQFTMWPWMLENLDGTQQEMGTYYLLATICDGRRLAVTTLIDNHTKRQAWWHKYEREHIVGMVKAIIKERDSHGAG